MNCNFAEQRNASALCRMHQGVEPGKSFSGLQKHFRIDGRKINSISLQPSIYFGCRFRVMTPFDCGPFTEGLHNSFGLRRYPCSIQSLQNRRDRPAPIGLKDSLAQPTITQYFP